MLPLDAELELLAMVTIVVAVAGFTLDGLSAVLLGVCGGEGGGGGGSAAEADKVD